VRTFDRPTLIFERVLEMSNIPTPTNDDSDSRRKLTGSSVSHTDKAPYSFVVGSLGELRGTSFLNSIAFFPFSPKNIRSDKSHLIEDAPAASSASLICLGVVKSTPIHCC